MSRGFNIHGETRRSLITPSLVAAIPSSYFRHRHQFHRSFFFFNIPHRRRSNPGRTGYAKCRTLVALVTLASRLITRRATRTGCGFPRTYRINYRYAEARSRSRARERAGRAKGIANESIKRRVGQDRVCRTTHRRSRSFSPAAAVFGIPRRSRFHWSLSSPFASFSCLVHLPARISLHPVTQINAANTHLARSGPATW